MSDQPASALLGGLLSDAKDLVSNHGKLVKLEVREELGELKQTIQRTGIAIASVVLAGLLLAQAAAFGLADATDWPVWAGFLIVGVLLAIIGYVTWRGHGRAHEIDLVPDKSIARAKHDLEHVADAAT